MSHDVITVLNGHVQLKQPLAGFRTAIDAVLLAAACPAEPGDHILDLGCGVGSAGLCLARRIESLKLSGIDIQTDHIALAQDNAALNGCEEFCHFETADIRDKAQEWKHTPGPYDHIICNPPFLESGTHLRSPDQARAQALGHEEASLQDWLEAGFYALKNGGSFTLIHRADHSDKIIQGLGSRFGRIEIIPLWPGEGKNAKRVIIRAIKNAKSPAALHPGLILHEKDGQYTKAANAVLRDMNAI